MSATGLRIWEREYSYLSYHYHVVLGVDEVSRLTYTVRKAQGTYSFIIPLA